MLKRITQLCFSELYMERSTIRSYFFKVKNINPLGRDRERNKKYIKKDRE
ncbi:MAG: hypothetical protein ACMUEL_06340 [Flavobacteriales bacterium Tduv]